MTERRIRSIEDVWIPMSDGVKLAAHGYACIRVDITSAAISFHTTETFFRGDRDVWRPPCRCA